MHTERGTWHACTSDSLSVRMNNESTKNTAPSKNAEQAHIHTYIGDPIKIRGSQSNVLTEVYIGQYHINSVK
eukprot:scaffold2035_cov107-Cylindrotheca_fusiformis.AAC.1